MIDVKSRPLLCRLNLHHHWSVETNSDGEHFHRCSKCGKDRESYPWGPVPG